MYLLILYKYIKNSLVWLTLLEIYVSNIHKRIQCTCMNTILYMMNVLYSFAIKPFLLLNNFTTKILNQHNAISVLHTFIVNYEKKS